MANLVTTVGQTGAPALPSWLTPALQQGLFSAQGAAASNPYTNLNHQTADYSPGQWAGLGGILNAGYYQPQMTQAQQIGAQQIGAGSVGSQDVAAGQVNQFAGGAGPGGLGIGGMSLDPYMNPYTQSVINQSDKDIQRQSGIQQQANDGRAAMSGAFGGDRAAIVNTETQRNAADTMARTDAGLRSQNFAQAQAAGIGDINRQLQAGSQQAQLGLTASQGNQASGLRADLANQQAQLTAAQANQNAQLAADKSNQASSLQSSQGNQFAGLQGKNLNLSALNAAQGQLTQEQATRQKAFDSQYADQQNRALYPANAASYLLSQTQKLPYGSLTNTNSNSVTNAPGPSGLGQALSAGVAGAGILGALGGSGPGGGIGGALGGAGSAISNGYNWLTGGSSGNSPENAANTLTNIDGSQFTPPDPSSELAAAGSGVGDLLNSGGADPASAFSSASDAASSAASSAGDIFGGAGIGSSSFDPSTLSFARGGVAGFADGGRTDRAGRHPLAVNLDGSYDDTYAPIDAGRGGTGTQYQGNLGIGALAAGADVPVPDGPEAAGAPMEQPAMAPPGGIAPQPAMAPQPAGAAPDAAPDAGVPDPSLPVPPIPPAGGPPAMAAPGPAASPTGIAAGPSPTQPNAVMAQGAGQGIGQGRPNRQPNMLDSLNQGQNPLWMALIQGGAAGMASGSHTALGALGAGLGAGAGSLAQQAQAQRQADATRYQADSLNAYRTGQVANGQGRVLNGMEMNNVRREGNDLKADRMDQQQPLTDARVAKLQADTQAAMNKAQKTPGLSGGQVLDAAARDLMNTNPGMTYADAVGHMKGLDTRQQSADQAGDRIAQNRETMDRGSARDANTQDYRQAQLQLRTTGAEDAAAKSVINSAATMGRTVTYADAVNQVRATRQQVGQAPIPQASGTAALRQAAGSPPQPVPGTQGAPAMAGAAAARAASENAIAGPPTRVNSREQAMALPPGTVFITPDGVTRQRPVQ